MKTIFLIFIVIIVSIGALNLILYISFIGEYNKYDIISLKKIYERKGKKYNTKYFEDKFGNTIRIGFNKQEKEYSINFSFYTNNLTLIYWYNKIIYNKLDYIYNLIK